MQNEPVNDASRQRQHQFGVGNTSEVVREVGVNNVRVTAKQQFFHLDRRLLGGTAPSKTGHEVTLKI
jgi:hypothetical protein